MGINYIYYLDGDMNIKEEAEKTAKILGLSESSTKSLVSIFENIYEQGKIDQPVKVRGEERLVSEFTENEPREFYIALTEEGKPVFVSSHEDIAVPYGKVIKAVEVL